MIQTKHLLYGVVGLITLDVLLTFVAVCGMGATELNPLSATLGFYMFMAAKIVLSFVAMLLLYKYAIPAVPTVARYGLLTLGGVYAMVCTSNIYQIMGAVA